MVRVVLSGLGAIGSEILRYSLSRGHEVSSVIDPHPQMVGKSVRDSIGVDSDLRAIPSIEEAKLDRVEVGVVATKSRFSEVLPEVEFLVDKGISVVTTCEEMAYPSYSSPEAARRLDAKAKERNVAVVGVGINPGFVTDWVPSVVASASKGITYIHALRSIDVMRGRRQLQQRAGVGLTKAKWEKELSEGKVALVGLPESLYLISLSLGDHLKDLKTAAWPVLGSEDYVIGARQFAEATTTAGNCRIRLDLEMTINSADFDVIEVKGEPNLKLRFEGGVFGDSATIALVVNAVERIGSARPGVITVLELPLTKRSPFQV